MPPPANDSNDVRFPTTRWTIVRQAAKNDGEEARAALESLCRDYRGPLLAFVRTIGQKECDAEDTLQEFLMNFVNKDGFAMAEAPKGRLRSFLCRSLRNFAVDEWRKKQAATRGGGAPVVSYDQVSGTIGGKAGDSGTGPVTDLSIAAYDRQWARTTMNMALEKLKSSYSKRGKDGLFDELKRLIYLERLSNQARSEIAARLGIGKEDLSVKRSRFQKRLRKVLREIISHTVDVEGKSRKEIKAEIDDEMRHLAAALTFEAPDQEPEPRH